jgi:hypothetical protein
VDTSVLDVLRNGVHKEGTLGGNTVDVDLSSTLDELGDNDGVLRVLLNASEEFMVVSMQDGALTTELADSSFSWSSSLDRITDIAAPDRT